MLAPPYLDHSLLKLVLTDVRLLADPMERGILSFSDERIQRSQG